MQYIGITLCVLFCALVLKDKHYIFAVVTVVFGICLLLFSVFSGLKSLIQSISLAASAVPASYEYIKLMLKVLVITLMTHLTGNICRDCGESALASTAETAAKITVTVMVLPLFESIIKIVGGLVK